MFERGGFISVRLHERMRHRAVDGDTVLHAGQYGGRSSEPGKVARPRSQEPSFRTMRAA